MRDSLGKPMAAVGRECASPVMAGSPGRVLHDIVDSPALELNAA
jgi:hypothetical protein